jgi:hypothetical protein
MPGDEWCITADTTSLLFIFLLVPSLLLFADNDGKNSNAWMTSSIPITNWHDGSHFELMFRRQLPTFWKTKDKERKAERKTMANNLRQRNGTTVTRSTAATAKDDAPLPRTAWIATTKKVAWTTILPWQTWGNLEYRHRQRGGAIPAIAANNSVYTFPVDIVDMEVPAVFSRTTSW